MLRYLHIQAFPLVRPLATQMVNHGYFTIIPNNTLGLRGAARAEGLPCALAAWVLTVKNCFPPWRPFYLKT
jgi:hypothetical protein